MSSNFWQMRKQEKLFKHGKTRISKIKAYVRTWEGRCYSDGIPDEVDDGVAKSMRAPSYKAIAICLLNNDHAMSGLGFSGTESKYYRQIMEIERERDSKQIKLFGGMK